MIDFYRFEETFRLGHPSISEDDIDGTPRASRRSKRPETISLLEPNRLRNVGKISLYDQAPRDQPHPIKL